MEDTQLATYSPEQAGAIEVRQQVNQLQYLVKSVLKEGEHYGVVPGTKGKPSLFLPGAEKIAFMFKLMATYKVERTDFNGGHREYQVECTLASTNTGEVVGSGMGSCSTLESKYRYRNKWVNGQKTREENPDIADTWNTVLKMAKKRAFVDAVKSTTAASDIFTQDVEDMPDYMLGRAPRQTEPQATTAPQRPAKPETPPEDVTYLKEALNRLTAAGYSEAETRAYLWHTYQTSGRAEAEKAVAQMIESAKQPEAEAIEPDLYEDEVSF